MEGVLWDFSGAFTDGAGSGNHRGKPSGLGQRPKLGNRPNIGNKPVSRNNKPQSRPAFGTPIVKTTRAMEMRQQANKAKQGNMNRSNTSNLSTIRERSFGKYFN